MTGAMRTIGNVTYWLGLIGMVVSVVIRILPHWAERVNVSARGGLVVAATLFLCSLASREMAKGS